jgi:long-chain acyl-CoA synthetase
VANTLINLFEQSCEKYPNKVCLLEKGADHFVGSTFRQIRESAYQFGSGLICSGIQQHDRIALISEGRNAWVISELGTLYAGGICVPLSVKLNEPSELTFRLNHSGCRFVIASGNQMSKILSLRSDLPHVEKVIALDGLPGSDPWAVGFQELMEEGAAYLRENPRAVQEAIALIRERDPVNICYTSGTTADPKGVILTHGGYCTNIEQTLAVLPINERDSTLLILPWDHAFAHIALYAIMKVGASIASVQVGKTPAETLRNIPINIRETRPTILLSVPALAQNFRKNIEKGIRQKGILTEKMFSFALQNAESYNGKGLDRGKGVRILRKPLVSILDRVLMKKVRAGFGGRLDYFIGGGALLDLDLQKFFYALGMPMYQGYGLTESGPVISVNAPQKHKLGSSGVPVPNMDIRICDPSGRELGVGEKGEIVVRGGNVMAGYWENEEATRESIRGGWLFTGDLGYLDGEGFLHVLGREKSLLISSDGEKYSPEGIEEAILSASKLIDQVMLYNNQSPYTVGLVVPNPAELKMIAKKNEKQKEDLDIQKDLLNQIFEVINQFRTGGEHAGLFPTKWLPSALAVLDEGFTEENRMLNSTLKMVRSRITEAYQERINDLLTPEGRSLYSRTNLDSIRKWMKW